MTHPKPIIEVMRDTFVDLVRQDSPELTARQLAVLLICCLEHDKEQTVRGLAARLKAPKPSITRALNKLEQLDLARRSADLRDLRSVLVRATPAGMAFVEALADAMVRSSRRPAASPGLRPRT